MCVVCINLYSPSKPSWEIFVQFAWQATNHQHFTKTNDCNKCCIYFCAYIYYVSHTVYSLKAYILQSFKKSNNLFFYINVFSLTLLVEVILSLDKLISTDKVLKHSENVCSVNCERSVRQRRCHAGSLLHEPVSLFAGLEAFCACKQINGTSLCLSTLKLQRYSNVLRHKWSECYYAEGYDISQHVFSIVVLLLIFLGKLRCVIYGNNKNCEVFHWHRYKIRLGSICLLYRMSRRSGPINNNIHLLFVAVEWWHWVNTNMWE